MITFDMEKQEIKFQGKEIRRYDIFAMYEDFKTMMGKVAKEFLKPIEIGDINVVLDEAHMEDYQGAMLCVKDMLTAKNEDETMIALFQTWLVSKTILQFFSKKLSRR